MQLVEYLLKELSLKDERRKSILAFSEAFRLKPYVKIIKDNPDLINDLRRLLPDKIKDNWDCIVELYRYNIKLSRAIYPYLAILENIIKVRISNYLKNRYGEQFYYDEELFFDKLGFNVFDREIFYKYFNHKINKFVREELIEKYKENNWDNIGKDKIKSKISQIKRAVSILSDAEEYRFKNKNESFSSFIEEKPTLNYWITLLEIKGLYVKNASMEALELKPIFPNLKTENIASLKTISNKLNDIRLLRNYISHYNRIICVKISKNLGLWDIYENIIELFYLLGCKDLKYIIGDINCCNESTFEDLYNKFGFLHKII